MPPSSAVLLLLLALCVLAFAPSSRADSTTPVCTPSSSSLRFVTLLPTVISGHSECGKGALKAHQLSAIRHNAEAVFAYTGTPLLVVQPHVQAKDQAENERSNRAFAELKLRLSAAFGVDGIDTAQLHALLLPVDLAPPVEAVACGAQEGTLSHESHDLLLTEVLRALSNARVSELSVCEVILLPSRYAILHPRFFNLLRYRFLAPLAGVPLLEDTEHRSCADLLSPRLDPEAALYANLEELFRMQPRWLADLPPPTTTKRQPFTVLSPRTSHGHIYEPLAWHWACPEQPSHEHGITFAVPPAGDQNLCYGGVLRRHEAGATTLPTVAVDSEVREWSRALLSSPLDRPSEFVRQAWEGSTVQTLVYGGGFLKSVLGVLVENHRQLSEARLHFLVRFSLLDDEELTPDTALQLDKLREQGVPVEVDTTKRMPCPDKRQCRKKLFFTQLIEWKSAESRTVSTTAPDSVIFIDADFLVLNGHHFARAVLVAQSTEFYAHPAHNTVGCVRSKEVYWNSGFFVMRGSMLRPQAIHDIQEATLRSGAGDQKGLSDYLQQHPSVLREIASFQSHCRGSSSAKLTPEVKKWLLINGYCKVVHGQNPRSILTFHDADALERLTNSKSTLTHYRIVYENKG